MKKTLIHTNPHLADEQRRMEIHRRQARESSLFEGARGLPKDQPPESQTSRAPASKASAKKSVSKAKSPR